MYILPDHINKGTAFIITKSQIEGRFDPHQYHFERINAIKRLGKNNTLLKLKNVVKNVKKITTSITPDDIYIGLENIESNTGEYIYSAEKESISSAAVFKKGQILFPKLRPYLNKVYLAEFDGICSTEFHVFDSPKFDNRFLAIYLRSDLIVDQTKHLMTGNTLPRLQTEDINKLPVPDLSFDLQNTIVEAYYTFYRSKKEKDNEAKLLRNSIDALILAHLKIVPPVMEDYGKQKYFIASFSDLTGSRFDPKLYEQSTRDLKAAIKASHFNKVPLKSLVTHSVAGDWGMEDSEEQVDGYQRCLVVRATEFDNEGNLNLNNSRVKYRLISKYKLKRMDIKPNDLLIEKSGGSPDQPVGRIALITEEMLAQNNLCYSNFIHKIRVDENKVLPEYLFYFLKAMHNIKLTDAMQSQTNGIRNLIMGNYFNQDIVLPDPAVQLEMVVRIRQIRSEIDRLTIEAKEVLSNAKRTVEQLILG